MSITGELREWKRKLNTRFTPEVLLTMRCEINCIADRIDAALEGYIELPKDADGVTIHLGERVQLIGNDPSTVSHMHLADDGWRVFVRYDGGLGMGNGKPESIRHVQPDSWERIIEDARTCLMSDHKTEATPSMRWKLDLEELVERCKRLAGDDE